MCWFVHVWAVGFEKERNEMSVNVGQALPSVSTPISQGTWELEWAWKAVGLWCMEKLPVDVLGLSISLLVFVLQIFLFSRFFHPCF